MKKFCFYAFLLFAVCLFFLFSCAHADSLYDVVTSVTAGDTTLTAGKILCYGRPYENAVTDETVSKYLGLGGYPQYLEKIEDFALYSSLRGAHCELALLKVYRAADAADGALFFERRIREVSRTLRMSGAEGHADTAYVRVYGNTVVLFMMPDNARFEKAIRSAL